MQYYNIIFCYGCGLFLTCGSIFIFLCFVFFCVWCVFSMWLHTGLEDVFRHQVLILPCGWCFFHGSLCGFIHDRDWTGCARLILQVVGIPIYIFVKVPHWGFRWLGSRLCIFDLWFPMGCWACWWYPSSLPTPHHWFVGHRPTYALHTSARGPPPGNCLFHHGAPIRSLAFANLNPQ